MADVRLIAIALLAACDAAGAAPGSVSGLQGPAGWQGLPDVAKAAQHELGATVTVEGVEAWGEPARGCYAVWIAVASGGTAEQLAEDVIAGLANPTPAIGAVGISAPARSVTLRDVTKPVGADGVLRLAFEQGGYRGKLAAKLGSGRIVALACFANQREPASCEPGCTALLGAIR